MTFSVAYWMLEMIVLCFGMQGEDVIEHTNGKYHVLHVQVSY